MQISARKPNRTANTAELGANQVYGDTFTPLIDRNSRRIGNDRIFKDEPADLSTIQNQTRMLWHKQSQLDHSIYQNMDEGDVMRHELEQFESKLEGDSDLRPFKYPNVEMQANHFKSRTSQTARQPTNSTNKSERVNTRL